LRRRRSSRSRRDRGRPTGCTSCRPVIRPQSNPRKPDCRVNEEPCSRFGEPASSGPFPPSEHQIVQQDWQLVERKKKNHGEPFSVLMVESCHIPLASPHFVSPELKVVEEYNQTQGKPEGQRRQGDKKSE